MSFTIEAIYENGVLKPVQLLPLQEQEKVRLTVEPVQGRIPETSHAGEALVRRSSGMLGWTGDLETFRRLALDPELDPQESA